MIIGKDPTTVAKEIKKHVEISDERVSRTDIDGNVKETEICPELLKSPYVCNPCTRDFFDNFLGHKLDQGIYGLDSKSVL